MHGPSHATQNQAGGFAPPIRALLLDDNQFDRARVQRLSRKASLNLQIDEVGSLHDMAEAARATDYDLFMIDYRLPVGDGIEAIELLRQDPRHNTAGNILITGDSALQTAAQAMRTGYHDVLNKSAMTAPDLRSAVLTAMRAARGRREQPTGPSFVDNFTYISDTVEHPLLQAQMIELLSSRLNTGHKCDTEAALAGLVADLLKVDEFVFAPQRSGPDAAQDTPDK